MTHPTPATDDELDALLTDPNAAADIGSDLLAVIVHELRERRDENIRISGVLDHLRELVAIARERITVLESERDTALQTMREHRCDEEARTVIAEQLLTDIAARMPVEVTTHDGDLRAATEDLVTQREQYRTQAHNDRYARQTTLDTAQALRTRVRDLERFIADLAFRGLRADLNPTMLNNDPEARVAFLRRYLHSLDRDLRAAAREWVPDIVSISTTSRPRPRPDTGASR